MRKAEEGPEVFAKRVQECAHAFGVHIRAVERDSWDSLTPSSSCEPLFHIYFETCSGPCELHFDRDGGEVVWRDRIARFESEDYPTGGMEQAIINCLALVFSGEAQRDPDVFPTAGGCMLVPTFPFLWPLGKVYRDVMEKRKKNR